MQTWFHELRDERGASAVEYGLLVALIAAVIILVVTSVGGKVNDAFQTIDTNMP
ncbi:MAG: Flp family type IVb pilin [Actinobacteria bacterium]|nr:Flp family type IVb pilin [Actinomycetota bacterium]